MKVIDCIMLVDSYEPNAYDVNLKARWVRECEGKVYTQLFLQQPIGFSWGSPSDFLQTELAIPAPYNQIYEQYLRAMIHYANAEPDRYNMDIGLFNQTWHDLCVWFGQDYDISDRARNRRVTIQIDGTGGEVREITRGSSFDPTYFQTLLRIPYRCAFVGGRVVVKRPFVNEYEDSNAARLWYGNPTDYLEQDMVLSTVSQYPVRMLIGDVDGTDLGIELSYPAEGEAFLTGILCQPEEEFFRWPEIRRDAPPPVIFTQEK